MSLTTPVYSGRALLPSAWLCTLPIGTESVPVHLKSGSQVHINGRGFPIDYEPPPGRHCYVKRTSEDTSSGPNGDLYTLRYPPGEESRQEAQQPIFDVRETEKEDGTWTTELVDVTKASGEVTADLRSRLGDGYIEFGNIDPVPLPVTIGRSEGENGGVNWDMLEQMELDAEEAESGKMTGGEWGKGFLEKGRNEKKNKKEKKERTEEPAAVAKPGSKEGERRGVSFGSNATRVIPNENRGTKIPPRTASLPPPPAELVQIAPPPKPQSVVGPAFTGVVQEAPRGSVIGPAFTEVVRERNPLGSGKRRGKRVSRFKQEMMGNS